jgi:hypothetical protein
LNPRNAGDGLGLSPEQTQQRHSWEMNGVPPPKQAQQSHSLEMNGAPSPKHTQQKAQLGDGGDLPQPNPTEAQLGDEQRSVSQASHSWEMNRGLSAKQTH